MLCVLFISIYYIFLPTRANALSTKDYIIELVKEKSEEYNIPFIVPLIIIERESGYNPKAINRNDGGEGYHSRGLVQVNSRWHNYTKEQVYNIEWSVEFLISNLAKGNCGWWSTCPINPKFLINDS